MIYLMAAILSSALVSILMRVSEGKSKSSAGMFIANYVVCTLFALFFIPQGGLFEKSEGDGFALGLGAICGVLFLAGFVLLQWNIRKNGVVLASIFMKLGVIVPVLMAILVFGETPRITHVIGIILAILAIVVINFEKQDAAVAQSSGMWKNNGNKLLLLILLATSGFADSMVNIYDKKGNSASGDKYLFFVFCFAGLCSVIMYFIKKEKLCKWDIIFGALIGIPNYFSSRFLMMALGSVSAVIAYPVYSVAAIVLISVAGILLFKEKLNLQKLVGLFLVVVALVFLNI